MAPVYTCSTGSESATAEAGKRSDRSHEAEETSTSTGDSTSSKTANTERNKSASTSQEASSGKRFTVHWTMRSFLSKFELYIQPRSGYIMTNTCFGAEFVAYSVRALYAICGRSRVQIQAASSFSAFLTVNRCVNRRQLRPTKSKRSFMTNLITVATGYGLLK